MLILNICSGTETPHREIGLKQLVAGIQASTPKATSKPSSWRSPVWNHKAVWLPSGACLFPSPRMWCRFRVQIGLCCPGIARAIVLGNWLGHWNRLQLRLPIVRKLLELGLTTASDLHWHYHRCFRPAWQCQCNSEALARQCQAIWQFAKASAGNSNCQGSCPTRFPEQVQGKLYNW